MKGPSKSARDALGDSIKRMERISTIAGIAVVCGVLVEVWPDILSCASGTCGSVQLFPIIGGIVVAVGVAVEVRMASRIATVSGEIQDLANREIAELNNETARLKLLSSYRTVGDREAFVAAMRKFAGTPYRTELLSDNLEVSNFNWEITRLLRSADWVEVSLPGRRNSVNLGVAVYTTSPGPAPAYSAASAALADWLHDNSVAVELASVRCDEFQVGTTIVVIGSRPETIDQHDIIRSGYVKLRFSRPVTPPKA